MKQRGATRRLGLAPLELVLVLPLLLFVMALMMNLGTGGAWKLRTQTNSRHAAWRALEHRSGANDPHPGNWPDDATLDVAAASPSPVPFDPFLGQAVVRGPVVTDPVTGEFLPVRAGYLDFLPGLLKGTAEISRPYPLLRSLPGTLAFARDHVVFDGTRFQFSSMDLPSNTERRVLGLYPLLLELRAPDEVQEYLDAATAVYFDPNESALLPLTGGDPEVYELIGQRSPDFQPSLLSASDWRMTRIPQVRTRVPDYCESNPGTVRSEKVEPFKRAIRNVPHDISDYYLGVYESVIQQLEQLNPRPPALQMLLDELTVKRDQVRAFRASLPPRQ
jgi:hypothetical protein